MKLETLVPSVALVAPAAPDPLIVEQLRLALDELAERTGFWIESVEADVEAAEATYRIPVTSGLIVRRIEEVRMNGTLLVPANAPDWMRGVDDWPAASGIPEAYAQIDPSTILLDCLPTPGDETWLLEFKVSVRPGASTASVADWIVNDQREALIAGAKRNLAGMPDRPWTNQAVELRETAHFERAVSKLAWRVAKGFTSAGPTGYPPSGQARFF